MTTPRPRRRDTGFTLVELLVVVIVIGLLGAISIPVFRDQRRQSLDRTVVADLERYSTAADRLFSASFKYPTTELGFDLSDRGTPSISPGNTFRAFTVVNGAKGGYVLYGQNKTTGTVWLLSSYDDGSPTRTTLTALPDAPPMAGTAGVPATVVPADWLLMGGIPWGAVPPPAAASSPVMPFNDPAYLALVKPVTSTVATGGQVFGYYSAPWRVVDIASPVSTRALQVTTDSATQGQGLILHRAPPGAAWPAAQVAVAAAGEVWTVSAWVKGEAGQGMTVGCRYMTPGAGYVAEASAPWKSATGEWERLTYMCLPTPSTVIGSYVDVQVVTSKRVPGTVFYVTAPQVNKGVYASPFQP